MLKKLKNDIIKIQENFGGAEMQEHFKTETAAMPLASMETRRMVAEDTRKIIEQAFASGEPYANFEIFRKSPEFKSFGKIYEPKTILCSS